MIAFGSTFACRLQAFEEAMMETLLVNPVTALTDVPVAQPPDCTMRSEIAPFPKTLVLDWTDYCNAKCFFCRRETYERTIGGMGEFVPFAKLKKLESVLSQVKTFCISSAIGEPLLHPELEEVLGWLYSINPSILLQVVTNGTTLTGDKASLFSGHLDWLSVSLNASNGQAHMRDMFPHLAKRGIDPEKRWALHVRHLTEFLAALPASDRARIKLQMVVHKHNVDDIVEFVRLVKRIGGSQAVITNIAVHPETVDWSLYWVKDKYNECVDEASVVGAQLGVQVHAARFYTSVKPELDLDKTCRDPIDVAYISRSSQAAPCCHWTEAPITADFYGDENAFKRYWNSSTLYQLRHKRDFASCRVCGMLRVFDETSFHFSPKMKQALIAAGRFSELDQENDYPDAKIVAACVAHHLDLPSIRRTLLQLGLPVEMADRITTEGTACLSELDQACWEALQKHHSPSSTIDFALAGPFLGMGWGAPLFEPEKGVSARPIGDAQVASVFVHTVPTLNAEVRFTIRQLHLSKLQPQVQLEVCGCRIEVRYSTDELRRTVLGGTVPEEVMRSYGGRLWVRVGLLDQSPGDSLGDVSFIRFEVSDARAIQVAQSKRSGFARAVLSTLATAGPQ
jgi:MoaA/NifB/PqqE/SkfB family radical SAM enzyme